MAKTIEVRCLQERRTKGDKTTKCGRFLLALDKYSITVTCSCCGARHIVTRDERDEVKVIAMPPRKRLISEEKG